MPSSHHAIDKDGIDFIKGFESFVPYPYDDKLPPVKGKYREWKGEPLKGTATIGYGHTDAAKHPLKVVPGLRITEADACKILDVDLDECEEDVNRLVKVPLTQGQFNALVSFTFNCGPANLKKLIVPLNKGDYASTRAKFDEFIRSKGEVMKGLIRRRDGEQLLWDAVESRPAASTIPNPEDVHNVPEQVDAPRQPVPVKAIALSAAGTAGAITAVAEPMKQVADAVSGLAGYGPLVSGVALALLVMGAAYLIYRSRR
jgi:lysozyme